jgi:DNA repair exonuclease SbcCD ATPase subunit
MILLELALLGVRNFQQITRFEFSPGLNLIQGGNGSGKTTLREALLFSLFGHSSEQAQSLIHPSSASTCQAAITFKAENGEMYRLAKDFVKDIVILSKYDPSIKKFLPIEKRKENVLRWLQQQCGGLNGSQISHYFVLDRSRLASSYRDPGEPRQAEVSTLVEPPAVQTVFESKRPQDSAAKQKRLQELKAIADQAEQLFQLEEQLSDAQSRVGVLKRKLADMKKLDQELEQILEKAKPFAALEGTTEQLQQLVEEFEEKLTERNREYQSLEDDRSLLEHQLVLVPTDPIYKNKTFIAGGVATILSFVSGLFVSLPGLYQHLYLLGLLIGLALMAIAVIMDMGWLSRKKILEDKIHGKLKNIELLEARFRRENIKFFDLLKKTNTDSVDAFKEKIKAYDFLLGSRQRLCEEQERLLEGKESEALQLEFEEKSGLIQELTKKIKGYQNIPSDLPSLREEIRILEKELAFSSGGQRYTLSSGPSVQTDLPTQFEVSVKTENGNHDSIKGLMQDPLAGNVNRLLDAARGVFKKLSRGAYTDILLQDSSHINLLPNNSSTPVPLETLSHGTLDQVFLSLYLGLIMNWGSGYPFPLLLDDPLLTLDSNRQEIILETLREIGKERQVILLSTAPYSTKEGDRQIRLS